MQHNCNAQIDSVRLNLNSLWNIVINSKFKQSCLNKRIITIEIAIDMDINCSEIISKFGGKKPDGKVQLTATNSMESFSLANINALSIIVILPRGV